MSYLGANPTSVAFVVDTFSGNGSNTTFTMQVAPAATSSMIVAISGVLQAPSTYGVNGTTLTFASAPAVGTGNISVRYLGIPASGVTSTAYRTYNEYTLTANQTSVSVASYTPGYINVHKDGVLLSTSDFTANTGVTVVLNTGAVAGSILQVESFYLTSIVNAIPAAPASIIGAYIANNTITASMIAPGVITQGITWQAVQNTSFLAYSSNGYFVNTNTASGNVYATLPASPSTGNTITFIDYSRTFASNNFIINPNGNKINSNTSNVIVNTNGASVSLVYSDSNQGWLASSGFTVSPIGNYSVNYLIVAGGGGGGGVYGGGGGAGGFLATSATLSSGTAYTITVGSGGSGGLASSPYNGTSGNNSAISTINTALGGGGGGGNQPNNGLSGGSGGGGGGAFDTGGSGTAGQGFAGGNGITAGAYNAAGGGGGASSVGGNGVNATSTAGSGGAGSSSSISGSAVTYAGGGGGGAQNGGTAGSGGAGGGGAGTASSSTAGVSATANTGGGGGGGSQTGIGGNGGSGIVIISYLGPQRGSGGTVTSSGGYTIHTFTSSGTYNA